MPLVINDAGWLEAAPGPDGSSRLSPSPHVDDRPPQSSIDLLVIHNISLPAGHFGGPHIEDLFLGRLDTAAHPSFADLKGLRVSSHFLIRRTGELVQFVSTQARAWHAGVSSFEGRAGCNDFSIGVELEGCDTQAFERIQIERLVDLSYALVARHPSLQFVAGHSDIAPGRKTDPGPWFPWIEFHQRLRDCKVSLYSPNEKPPVV